MDPFGKAPIERPPNFDLAKEILNDMDNSKYNDLDKNWTNILHLGSNQWMIKQLHNKSEYQPRKGIRSPKLFLISGAMLTGKSTLAEFLKSYVSAIEHKKYSFDQSVDKKLNKTIRLISTDAIQEIMRKYITEEEDAIHHAPVYNCG